MLREATKKKGGRAMKQYKLIELRSKLGLTQSEIAKRIGVSRSFYTQIEQGTRAPSTQVLFRLAQEINEPVETFFCPKLMHEATKR